MRIVVTGGAGFIGSAVCRMLVAERGANVLNIDKLTATSSLASLKPIAQSPRYSFRKADVCERERIAALLHAFAPDAIIHAACELKADGDIRPAIETNVVGTWRLLEAARDYWSTLPVSRQERFRFLSVSELGDQASPVAASRTGADELVTAWQRSYGLPTIVSKAAPTCGPHQFPQKPLPAAVLAAIDGQPPVQIGDAEPTAWVYVDDHVRALLAMLDKGTPGATYQVAGRGRVVPSAVVDRIAQLVERHGAQHEGSRLALARQVEAAKAALTVAAAEPAISARLEQDTGWCAEETAETALSKTVRWYLANEAWWRPLSATGDAHGLLRIA